MCSLIHLLYERLRSEILKKERKEIEIESRGERQVEKRFNVFMFLIAWG